MTMMSKDTPSGWNQLYRFFSQNFFLFFHCQVFAAGRIPVQTSSNKFERIGRLAYLPEIVPVGRLPDPDHPAEFAYCAYARKWPGPMLCSARLCSVRRRESRMFLRKKKNKDDSARRKKITQKVSGRFLFFSL